MESSKKIDEIPVTFNTTEERQVEDLQDTPTVDDFRLSGRRIVDILHLIKNLQLLNDHSPLGCSISDMVPVAETRRGLNSGIRFKCKMCNVQEVVWTEKMQSESMQINTAAVSGAMSIGCGFSNLEEFLSCLNVPSMSSNTFQKEHDYITAAWEKTASEEMKRAAMEEKRLAVEAGEVDADGIPLLTVVVDGCWAKRSYRTNYSSLSGAVSSFPMQASCDFNY